MLGIRSQLAKGTETETGLGCWLASKATASPRLRRLTCLAMARRVSLLSLRESERVSPSAPAGSSSHPRSLASSTPLFSSAAAMSAVPDLFCRLRKYLC